VGRPIVAAEPDSEASLTMIELARRIDEDPPRRRFHPELKIG
jgi:hypothetical protein